ncbi:MAG: hypothetical protein OEV44_14875 [Spirochaetota bacterium]|nr:hypothetical protein [Spirochaetota bacterium]
MWWYIRPFIIIAIIIGLAFFLTHSCVERTGEPYYRSHYIGGVLIDGYWHVPRSVGIRGGK